VPGTGLWPLCTGIRTGGLRRRTLWCARQLVYGRALTALTVRAAPPRRYSPRCRATRPAWWAATHRPEPFS